MTTGAVPPTGPGDHTTGSPDDVLLARIGDWLALTDPWPGHVDLMLAFGGSLPRTWEVAARAVQAGEVGTLMLVGGRGHTTDATLAAVGMPAGSATTEAEAMATWLRERHGITDVLLETRSTNCGNNVTLAQDVARAHGLRPATVALVQDPTMQRRMDAVFRRVWSLGGARAVNRPGPDSRCDWPAGRWASLVMGEVPRLRDDERGYGPAGAGFLAHVDVPDDVLAAHAELSARHPGWLRAAVETPGAPR